MRAKFLYFAFTDDLADDKDDGRLTLSDVMLLLDWIEGVIVLACLGESTIYLLFDFLSHEDRGSTVYMTYFFSLPTVTF